MMSTYFSEAHSEFSEQPGRDQTVPISWQNIAILYYVFVNVDEAAVCWVTTLRRRRPVPAHRNENSTAYRAVRERQCVKRPLNAGRTTTRRCTWWPSLKNKVNRRVPSFCKAMLISARESRYNNNFMQCRYDPLKLLRRPIYHPFVLTLKKKNTEEISGCCFYDLRSMKSLVGFSIRVSS